MSLLDVSASTNTSESNGGRQRKSGIRSAASRLVSPADNDEPPPGERVGHRVAEGAETLWWVGKSGLGGWVGAYGSHVGRG